MPLRKLFLIGFAAGATIAIGMFVWHSFSNQLFGETELLFWPSSILLAATTDWSSGWPVLVISIALNALWYGALGTIIGLVTRLVRR
jgi:hypothetical protein